MSFTTEWKEAWDSTGRFLLLVLFVLLCCYPLTGILSIRPEEAGVLLRFGKVINDKLPPGMHYTFPWPIDQVIRVPVRQVRTFSVGLFYPQGKERVSGPDQPHLLTGDKNLVQIRLNAQFSIVNPGRYLFVSADPEKAAHDVVAAAVVSTAAAIPVENLLTIGRLELQKRIQKLAQTELDILNLGIHLRAIEVKDVNPPQDVLPHFKDVVNAQMERNTKKHNAESRCSALLARAKSLARTKVERARADKTTVVSKAQGAAARFTSMLKEYKSNPGPTRKRLYLEMMEELLPRFRQVIRVEGKGQDSTATIRIGIRE